MLWFKWMNYLIITQSTKQFIPWKINTHLSLYLTFSTTCFGRRCPSSGLHFLTSAVSLPTVNIRCFHHFGNKPCVNLDCFMSPILMHINNKDILYFNFYQQGLLPKQWKLRIFTVGSDTVDVRPMKTWRWTSSSETCRRKKWNNVTNVC
jgi:hypothetical protein